MTANGSIIRPNHVSVEAVQAPGTLATPLAMPINTNQGIKFAIFGGLTKVEALAGQIAGGIEADDPFIVAGQAVDLAEAILAECESRRKAAEAGKESL